MHAMHAWCVCDKKRNERVWERKQNQTTKQIETKILKLLTFA